MTKIVESYVLLEQIGEGQFGEVYRAKHISTEEYYAVKMLMFEKFAKSSKLQELIINEVQSLKKLDNQNIIRFFKLLKTSNHIYLVYEFCGDKSLQNYLLKRKFLPEDEALKIFKQLVSAFRLIHQNNIVHCDIKPANLLFNQDVIKVAQFGLCKTLGVPNKNPKQNDKNPEQLGSPIYMALEALKGEPPSKEQDIYSLGIVLYEMLFGFCPYENSNLDLLIQMKESKVQFKEDGQKISLRTQQLVEDLMQLDPSKRLTIEEVNNYLSDYSTQPTYFIEQKFNLENEYNSKKNFQVSNYQKEIQQVKTEHDMIKNETQLVDNMYQINMKLLKERNKSIYMSNIMCAILDLNLNQNSAKVVFLMLKQMNQITKGLMNILKSDKANVFSDQKQWSMYIQTLDYVKFKELIKNEHKSIHGNILQYQQIIDHLQSTDINLEIEMSSTEIIDAKYFQETLLNYVKSVINQSDMNDSNGQQYKEYCKKLKIHANNVLDCIQIHQFFEIYISNPNPYIIDQSYFQVIASMNDDKLKSLVDVKFKQLQQMK